MIETMEPNLWIEEQHEGYVLYWNSQTGERTEVTGVCDGNRVCMVGAVVDGREIKTVEDARALPSPLLDCPVGPGFSGCCDLDVRVLP